MTFPTPGTVEQWAHSYVTCTDLRRKLEPGQPPRAWSDPADLVPIAVKAPGRPAELSVETRGHRTPGLQALRQPAIRAQLLHTFLHHELQAAELMCRALLMYPQTPTAFRKGLLGICQDEIRHMAMYSTHLRQLGHRYGDFPVNDWFWRKLPLSTTPVQFVALMGLGFEGGNLDHTRRFAARFRDVGDVAGAELQERIGDEEIPHVAFAAHWFEVFSGLPLTFETWQNTLPPPLSPKLMRGRPIQREARLRAGLTPEFVDALSTWVPDS